MSRSNKKTHEAAVVAYVSEHEPTYRRSVSRVARAVGLDEIELRALVHESDRLRMRTTGVVGWHIVELAEG